jgi:hypothetical protein
MRVFSDYLESASVLFANLLKELLEEDRLAGKQPVELDLSMDYPFVIWTTCFRQHGSSSEN